MATELISTPMPPFPQPPLRRRRDGNARYVRTLRDAPEGPFRWSRTEPFALF